MPTPGATKTTNMHADAAMDMEKLFGVYGGVILSCNRLHIPNCLITILYRLHTYIYIHIIPNSSQNDCGCAIALSRAVFACAPVFLRRMSSQGAAIPICSLVGWAGSSQTGNLSSKTGGKCPTVGNSSFVWVR